MYIWLLTRERKEKVYKKLQCGHEVYARAYLSLSLSLSLSRSGSLFRLLETFVRAIAAILDCRLDKLLGRFSEIERPAELREHVDDTGGGVETAASYLGRSVILGEHVVVIVPALAEGHV